MFVPFRDKARAQHACEHVMPHQARRALLEPWDYILCQKYAPAQSRSDHKAELPDITVQLVKKACLTARP